MSAARHVTADELARLTGDVFESADYYAGAAARHGGVPAMLDAARLYLAAEAIQRRMHVLRDIEASDARV